ncbi:MAG TPA: hypothetical protein VGP26_27725 [Actinophytocola sp.]|nr:hypothetical protein [Actinophytocola sp.]
MSGEPRLSGDADVELQLLALLAIVDRGCALQPRAEAVLHDCATIALPGPEVAREGGYVAGEYHRLHGWAADADRAGPIDALYKHVALLMMQHCMLVHYAVRLAFPKTAHRPARCPIAPELGDPARRLRASRDELARRVDET